MAFALHIIESDIFLPGYRALLGCISIGLRKWAWLDGEAFSEHCVWAGDEIHVVLVVNYNDNVRNVDALRKIVVDNNGGGTRPLPVRRSRNDYTASTRSRRMQSGTQNVQDSKSTTSANNLCHVSDELDAT